MNSANRNQILGLVQFYGVDTWRERVTWVGSLVPDWLKWNMFKRAAELRTLLPSFDCLVTHKPDLVPIVAGIWSRLRHQRLGLKIIYQGFMWDTSLISRFESQGIAVAILLPLSYIWQSLLLRVVDKVIVYSKFEVELYARLFRLPTEKFAYIHYHVDSYPLITEMGFREKSNGDYALAAGCNRDFETFLRALDISNRAGVIIASRSAGGTATALIKATSGTRWEEQARQVKDPEKLDIINLSGLTIYFDVSRERYLALHSQAAVIVVPLYARKYQRSLGQISALTAFQMSRPVIAARTWQLAEYITDGETGLLFNPEDFDDLCRKISICFENKDVVKKLVENGLKKATEEFSPDLFARDVLRICDETQDARQS